MTELGRAGRDRWLLYQSSIGSPVYDILAARPERKLVNYHNITPAALLRDWEPNVGYEVALGRTQLARLAPQSRLAVADSAFNESELRALGYDDTAVVPLLIDMHQKSDEPDPTLMADLARRKEATGRRRPSLRRQGLAAQSAARPRQDARRATPSLRSGGAPAPGGLAAGRDLRARVARVHRRARTDRRRQLRRVRQRSRARGVPAVGRRVRLRLGPRGFLRALGRGHGARRPDRRLWRDRGARDGGGQAGLVLPDKSPVHFASAVARVLADPTLRQHLSSAGRARAAGFSLPDSQRRFVSLVQEAIGTS